MYPPPVLAAKYLRYYFTAQNGRGHGIHSPFIFDFVINVLNDRRYFYAYQGVEYLRARLLNDSRIIEVEDMGAGSVVSKLKQRKIKDIAKYAAKPAKYGQLLFRMVNYYAPTRILELGTSLGLTTSYLAQSSVPVITLEGAPAVALQALDNFRTLGLENIRLIEGNFDALLPRILEATGMPEFVFLDGNHRYEPTCRYFDLLAENAKPGTILVFDDIHWSREMEEAWKTIKKHPAVTLTIDLFFIGIVFFRKEFRQSRHVVIRY